MKIEVFWGLFIPFMGTVLGSGCVLFMKNKVNTLLQKGLTGFASGVMVAASIWSLIIPAIDQSADMGKFAFFPTVLGFWIGVGFLFMVDNLTPHLHLTGSKAEGPQSHLSRATMLTIAVAIHNIPEGMAVGVVFAGWLSGQENISLAGALALAIGIAIQNFPDGAIIAMPLRAEGNSRKKSFLAGVLSGIDEPIAAIITILLAQTLTPFMPYLLAFAAGAMFYVVVEELIPDASTGEHSDIASITFSLGFTIMLVLEIALG